jgi:hypothetical protein
MSITFPLRSVYKLQLQITRNTMGEYTPITAIVVQFSQPDLHRLASGNTNVPSLYLTLAYDKLATNPPMDIICHGTQTLLLGACLLSPTSLVYHFWSAKWHSLGVMRMTPNIASATNCIWTMLLSTALTKTPPRLSSMHTVICSILITLLMAPTLTT